MLQSGKFRIFKNEGSGQVDTSSDSIGRITANITELDAILADYEASVPRAQRRGLKDPGNFGWIHEFDALPIPKHCKPI